jgi:hypothetical protein
MAAAGSDSVRQSDAEIARAAVVHALASNLAMLAVVVAVNVAVAKRDAITRAGRRAVAYVRDEADEGQMRAQLAELAADVCQISHADLREA